MTILDHTGESELDQLRNTIHELSEQIARNKSLSATLHASVGTVKAQAAHSQTGFVLRRFNGDKPQDVYDSELERMNASLAAENQVLLHDNKQLGTLIKEYEQTLESVMGAFRTRARDVQEQELTLIREYEARLLAKESENLLRALSTTTAESVALGRVSATLRALLRVLNGEDAAGPVTGPEDGESEVGEEGDWALERECELARLVRENAVLRRLLGEEGGMHATVVARAPLPAVVQKRPIGGAPGTVGPYGTYKRLARG